MSGRPLSRREFLLATGWAAGGITVLTSCNLVPVLPTLGEVDSGDGAAWVQIRGDGSVVFLCPRTEMGQGIATGLTQVVAEELALPNSAIDCVYPASNQITPPPMTVGSRSIADFFLPVAHAAASLRHLLAERAARVSGVPVESLEPATGGFLLPDGSHLTYGELIDSKESTVSTSSVDTEVALLSRRPSAERSSVGHVREPVHIDRLVTGTELYSRDVQIPDMAFGAVAKPPQIGAELLDFDRRASEAIPGVIAVVAGPENQVGVVAETPMAMGKGILALQPRWSTLNDRQLAAVETPLDIDQAIAQGTLDHTPISEGDLDFGRSQAAHHLDVRYDTPMMAHASIEPRSGVARVEGGRCEIFTGSQDPWYVQALVARVLGFSTERVLVHNYRVGGAFGGRSLCQASVEAAWLAAGSGRPVKVQWSREEEFAINHVGPQFSHRIQAGVDAKGDITYWHHRMIGSPILMSSAMIPDHLHWAADIPADPGTRSGTEISYRAPNRRVDFSDVRRPMPTGPWRGLGAAPNTFAVECTVDELAQKVSMDPLLFRQRAASSERLVEVLSRVRQLSGWDAQQLKGAHLGVAATEYDHATCVAVVARVVLEDESPRVDGLWCAQDCGLVVCPDQVRAQIEGNMVWGIGMALHEEFRLAGGCAATQNFDSYHLARNSDVPKIEIALVESERSPSGSGEAAFAPAAAAIVNAISRMRGGRLRSLPLGTEAGWQTS